IDLATGKIRREIPIKGAAFLNDLDVDPATGDVYVTDSFNDAIWRVVGGKKAKPFLRTPKLEGPNGILVEEDALLIGAFGPGVDRTTFQTTEPGRVLRVDRVTKAISPLSDRIGNLDGMERDGADLIVSDFWGGQLLRVHPDGSTELIMRVLPTAADLGFDPKRRVLGLPQTAANVVVFFNL
ncbi:MAG: hypothetical protein ACREQ9_18005, partial [Candidatus Binatia bacterium]